MAGGINVFSYVFNDPLSRVDPLGLWQTRRVIRGAAALAGGALGLGLGVASVPTTGGISAPVGIGLAMWGGVAIGWGVVELARGVVEPGASAARDIPEPYLSTMVLILATGGDLELAECYNDVSAAVGAVNATGGLGPRTTSFEMSKYMLDWGNLAVTSNPFASCVRRPKNACAAP